MLRLAGCATLVLAGICALPAACAALQATLAPVDKPLEVGVPTPVEVTLSLDCDTVRRHAGPAAAIPVAYQLLAGPGIPQVGPLGAGIPRAACALPTTASATVEAKANVTATREAQADVQARLVLEAAVEASATTAAAQATDAVPVLVAFRPALEADAPLPTKAGAPQRQILFPTELTSHANGHEAVRFSFAEEPDPAWAAMLPSDVVLAWPGLGDGQHRKQAHFTVVGPYHNGPNDHTATFHLLATPMSTLDPEVAGGPVPIQLTAHSKGMYVPGPGAAGLALAGIVGACWARRRAA